MRHFAVSLVLLTSASSVQRALIHENIIQILSQPLQLGAHSSFTTSTGEPVELKGFGCAHFTALQYINRIVMDPDFANPQNADEVKQSADITSKCEPVVLGYICLHAHLPAQLPALSSQPVWKQPDVGIRIALMLCARLGSCCLCH
jgi:hypothetical protein